MRKALSVNRLPAVASTLLLLVLAIPWASGKNEQAPGQSGRFRGLDRNNDGRITRDEWHGSANSFSVHDRNRDGELSGTEVGPALEAIHYDDFQELDRSRDGRISRSEWGSNRTEFDRLDSSRDGVLTRQEYEGSVLEHHDSIQTRPQRSAEFLRLDRNSNGKISRDEWTGDRKSFDVMDDNKNGQITRDEFLEMTRDERIAAFKRFDLNNNNVIGDNEWSGDKRSFERLDTNLDGRLTRDEFLKSFHLLDEHFRSLDRDHDGLVSRSEWQGERKLFERLDDNHDTRLSFDELLGVS